MSELEMYRGDDESFDIAVTKDGIAVDLTGASIRFTAKRRATDVDLEAVIAKTSAVAGGIVVTNALGGIARVDIVPADTEDLTASARLIWDLQAVDGTGKVRTLADGTLIVHADVSRTKP
jgi:hypothetical protein